jgi:hypothetical protein
MTVQPMWSRRNDWMKRKVNNKKTELIETWKKEMENIEETK